MEAFEFWEQLSRPLLSVLTEPRTWDDLNAWAKQNRFGQSRLRQSIAWLEHRGKAVSFLQRASGRATTYWVHRDWLKAHERQLRS